MDSSDLKVFATIARLGGINRAASELNTVQSNVTVRIRQLEEDLGTRLFDRSSHGVVLTAAGRKLLPYAQKVAVTLAEAGRALRDDGRPNGSLVIGSLETTAALRLSPALASFVASYPSVDLVLRTGTTAELIEDVLKHRLEGAFVCGPVEHPELNEMKICKEELVLFSAPPMRSLGALKEIPALKTIVLRAGCSYRLRLEAFLSRMGIVNFRQLEFGTLETVFNCVAAGLGVTLLPRSLLSRDDWPRKGIAIHELPDGEGLVDTVFVRRRDCYTSSALTSFVDLAKRPLRLVEAAE